MKQEDLLKPIAFTKDDIRLLDRLGAALLTKSEPDVIDRDMPAFLAEYGLPKRDALGIAALREPVREAIGLMHKAISLYTGTMETDDPREAFVPSELEFVQRYGMPSASVPSIMKIGFHIHGMSPMMDAYASYKLLEMGRIPPFDKFPSVDANSTDAQLALGYALHQHRQVFILEAAALIGVPGDQTAEILEVSRSQISKTARARTATMTPQ